MKKILLVDDEVTSLKIMQSGLPARDYAIVTAGDAISAVAVARREKPDLIVLDVGLPGGDAIIVMKRLSAMLIVTPIIVVSATESNRDRALASGARAFLTKPLDPSQLRRTIRVALGEEEVAHDSTADQ